MIALLYSCLQLRMKHNLKHVKLPFSVESGSDPVIFKEERSNPG